MQLECQDGRFGYNCEETCGNCAELQHCHHKDGTCMTGCAPGYDFDRNKSCQIGNDTSNK